MAIKAIKNRDNLVDEVYEQMKDHIVNGEWGPGEKIPSENELSELFNVSRTTIRNAIQKLKAIGILTTEQGRGTFVRKTINENLAENLIPLVLLDKDNILEILEFRMTIEMESVRLAAQRADDADIARIKRALDVMLESQDDHPRYSIADYQFHLNIARASRNKIFLRVMTEFKDILFSHFDKMNRDLGPGLGLANHVAIFEAIEKKDPELARSLMRKNLELSINRLKEHQIYNGRVTANGEKSMTKRDDGDTGLLLPPLGIGCWSFGGGAYWGEQNQSDVEAVVHQALDRGCNYFDTAEVYNDGDSEVSLGRALKGRRNEALIGSKVKPSACHPHELRRHCEASLERLGTDYLDLYMIHWPLHADSIRQFTDDESIINNPPDILKAMPVLGDLQKEGKIHQVGVSNFGVEQLREALASGVRIAVNQLPYNLLYRAIEFELLPFCREHDIRIIAYVPLMQGLLTGKYQSADDMPPVRTRTRHFRGDRLGSRHGGDGFETETFETVARIRRCARAHGVSMNHLALAWIMATPGISCTIAGARNAAQLDELAQVLDFSLPADLKGELDRAGDDLKQKMGPWVDLYQSAENTRTY